MSDMADALDDVKTRTKTNAGQLESLDGTVRDMEGALDDVTTRAKTNTGQLESLDGTVRDMEGALDDVNTRAKTNTGQLESLGGTVRDMADVLDDVSKRTENNTRQHDQQNVRIGRCEATVARLEDDRHISPGCTSITGNSYITIFKHMSDKLHFLSILTFRDNFVNLSVYLQLK